ncbi:MAG: hypothetical protein A2Y45_04735 [Tenericutes bacterium GWC2_34_14]|nr:MAG: hypothetical protein A2Z84_00875 [Tenericutes bacterium GWA2_35_7]OHE29103.1 MAG: hypothetical protein A2Y45_04735 [Tenericutes bacterium GWC2_34_14]OHE34063.1 MAG: hypothetical protein A2012_05390 [Tenericutes bacterium GWE2_34_108]OHE35393.1 MAG: hypothetical protein A2Y46_04735 [Tenericutes bacterium GWF1_35_14]OHE38461.1 MAG: hypothetical protein A2Y44_08010 [Tenericutes bacterium GWF2_35_184]OHE43101.1 MAG: hypothetical protein A2221_05580 [Tenericutes bacterium RIFOXYA2_FULL_36_3
MMHWLLFILSGIWLVFNVLWIIILFVRKKQKLNIPQEIHYHIKKTMKFNLIYVIIFSILGFLFL